MRHQDKADVAFPSYYLERIHEDAEDLNHALAKLCRDICTEPLGGSAPGEGGLASSGDLFAMADPAAAQLRAMAIDALNGYLGNLAERLYDEPARLTGGIDISAWAHILRGGQPLEVAADPGVMYAGIYCVAVPGHIVRSEDPAGDIVLLRPLPGGAGPALKSRHQIRAEDGLLVLFPGYMRHGVPSFSGGAERIAVEIAVRARA
jgi:hypothetical protein